MIEISKHAKELSSYTVRFKYFDENSDAMTPNSVYYSLLAPGLGAVTYVNSVHNIGVDTPSSLNDVTFTNSDLAIFDAESFLAEVDRKVQVSGNYDSDKGTGLTFAEEATFPLDNLGMA